MSIKHDLSKAADQCVMCGMCLPHCPTYQVSQHEAESPRGRISLIKALADDKLTSSKALDEHLQSCTGCLRCQYVCPAKVNYQSILDMGRDIYYSKQNIRLRSMQTLAITTSTNQWGHTALKLASLATSYLPGQSRRLRLLRRVLANNKFHTACKHQTLVNVFPGCTGRLFDQQTFISLIKLLDTIKVQALIPKDIMCCGAISQHSGQLNKASHDVSQLKQHLSIQRSNILLSFASGCGRQLDEQLANTSIKHFDALHWLSKQDSFKKLEFANMKKRVLMHNPCSQSISDQQLTQATLQKVPGIELIQFDDNLACCGAGGLQLTSPQASNALLLTQKLNTISSIKPDIIVSSNVGCTLNFQLGLEDAGLDIKVIHPLTLLAKQLIQ